MIFLKDFGVPTRIAQVSSNEELLRLINIYNGVTNVYASLYWYEIISTDEFSNEIRKAHIDKLFIDIDGDLESTKKLVDYLLKEDLQFHINFSGRGYHIYIKTMGEGNATNLRIAQLSILHESGASADLHVVGDVQRISRVPNTWNFSANKYCIPIHIEELGKENASIQKFENISYGSKPINLPDFIESRFEYLKPEIVPNLNINGDILLIPCMRNIISIINPRHDQRFLLAVYLSFAIRNGKDLWNFDSKSIIEKIMDFMKTNCTHWIDFSESKTRYYLNNIIPKFNPIVDCKFIKSKGCCIGCYSGGI